MDIEKQKFEWAQFVTIFRIFVKITMPNISRIPGFLLFSQSDATHCTASTKNKKLESNTKNDSVLYALIYLELETIIKMKIFSLVETD